MASNNAPTNDRAARGLRRGVLVGILLNKFVGSVTVSVMAQFSGFHHTRPPGSSAAAQPLRGRRSFTPSTPGAEWRFCDERCISARVAPLQGEVPRKIPWP